MKTDNIYEEKIKMATEQKHALKLMLTFCLCLLVALILNGFIHETIHGFFSQLAGRSVSSGFVTMGNPYTAPGDPDFRLGWTLPSHPYPMFLLASAAPTYFGFLIAIIATLFLVKLKKPSIKGLIAQAIVIATTLFYIIGGILIFVSAVFGGVLRVEDISFQGLILAMSARGEDPSLLAFEDVIGMPLGDLIFSPWFWLPIVIPFSIALICYIISERKFNKLFAPVFGEKWFGWKMTGLIVLTIIVWLPIVMWLDRVIRINWIA